MELIVSNYICLKGTSELARQNEALLLERFPGEFVENAMGLNREIGQINDSSKLKIGETDGFTGKTGGTTKGEIGNLGAALTIEVADTGIFGALWELAEHFESGLLVDLFSIPIRQETIEVCECFDKNPYRLASWDCLLIAVEGATALVWRLRESGYPATIIGHLTPGKDRLILCDGRRQYLTPPERG